MTKAYPSNLTWEQWELIADLFPSAKPGGRPRKIAMYAVVNAILYGRIGMPKKLGYLT
jgi:putative transposase